MMWSSYARLHLPMCACCISHLDNLCRYDLQKQLALLTLGYEKDGLTLEPAVKYNIDTKQATPLVALSQKKGADTLKASYDVGSEKGSLEWSRKPYKVHSIRTSFAILYCHARLSWPWHARHN